MHHLALAPLVNSELTVQTTAGRQTSSSAANGGVSDHCQSQSVPTRITFSRNHLCFFPESVWTRPGTPNISTTLAEIQVWSPYLSSVLKTDLMAARFCHLLPLKGWVQRRLGWRPRKILWLEGFCLHAPQLFISQGRLSLRFRLRFLLVLP